MTAHIYASVSIQCSETIRIDTEQQESTFTTVGPWNVIFSVSSAFQSKIPHYVSLPWDGGSQPCPLSDPRPTAVCLFCALRDMWGKAADVPKIDRLRHLSVSFCITLTVSVKREQERERQAKQRDRDPLLSKRVNCCFLCFRWLMPTCHSGVLPLVSSVFCKIVIIIEIGNSIFFSWCLKIWLCNDTKIKQFLIKKAVCLYFYFNCNVYTLMFLKLNVLWLF